MYTMERTSRCSCCLRRPPDRDMKIPYITFGKTEIYSDMLKECFEIHLTKLLSEDDCGICEVCVGRLRDASDFKRQVLRSQTELQGLLDKAKAKGHVKEETPSVKSEISENDEQPIHLSQEVKLEMSDPLPSAETEFKEFEMMLDTQVSSIFKQEPTFEYAYEPSCTISTSENIRIKKEHTCKACGQQFAKKSHLKMHRKIHKENKCEVCHKQFKYKCNLDKHRRVHTKPYVCDVCNKQFARAYSLNRHTRVHTGEKPYSCDECKKKFSDISQLNAHKRVHTGDTPFSCDICKAKFVRKESLIAHIGRHQGKKYYQCKICHRRFFDYPKLYQHKLEHTGDIYKCEECGKMFTNKYGLTSHLKTHGERIPYSCDYCAKKLATLASLQSHQMIHTKEKPYSCETCHKSFRHKHNLMAHQLTHTGERPHCCEVCGKQFARKDNLKTHLETHADGNYSCDLCTKSYSTKEGLRQHRRSHRKKKTLAKFVSKKKKKFQKSADFNIHLQIDT